MVALLEIGLDDIVAVLGTGVRHDADALERGAVVEQGRHDHGKTRFGRAGPARYFTRKVLGARDVLVFVVVFEIDLMQAACLGAAARKVAPAAQLLVRWAAVRTAGEAAKFFRRWLRVDRPPDLEIPHRRATQVLRARRRQAEEEPAQKGCRLSRRHGLQCRRPKFHATSFLLKLLATSYMLHARRRAAKPSRHPRRE